MLTGAGVLDEDTFWRGPSPTARATTPRTVPHLADRLRRHDLFAEEFTRLLLLNRLQLRNNRQMVDLADPSTALQFAGTLANPLARFAPPR